MRNRARARAIALRRQKDPMPWLPWVALLAILLAGLTAAQAQTSVRPAPDSSGPQMAVPAVPPSGSSSGTVARPPGNIDPGIHVPAPAPRAGTMPVIPPPGTPGGNPNVIPK